VLLALLHSSTDCAEIWESQTPVILETFYLYACDILCASLLEVCGLQFRRHYDKATGYSELVISKREEMK
jgi:hypothetical protein